MLLSSAFKDDTTGEVIWRSNKAFDFIKAISGVQGGYKRFAINNYMKRLRDMGFKITAIKKDSEGVRHYTILYRPTSYIKHYFDDHFGDVEWRDVINKNRHALASLNIRDYYGVEVSNTMPNRDNVYAQVFDKFPYVSEEAKHDLYDFPKMVDEFDPSVLPSYDTIMVEMEELQCALIRSKVDQKLTSEQEDQLRHAAVMFKDNLPDSVAKSFVDSLPKYSECVEESHTEETYVEVVVKDILDSVYLTYDDVEV